MTNEPKTTITVNGTLYVREFVARCAIFLFLFLGAVIGWAIATWV